MNEDFLNENEEKELAKFLCFIKYIGIESDGFHSYEFFFTHALDIFWGDDFSEKPACFCEELIPYSDTYDDVIKIKLNFKLDLIQNSTAFSIQDCIDHCVALAYENIDDKEYPEDGRIVFQFGEPFETVEDILARRHCFF